MQACRAVWYGNGDMRSMPHLSAKLRRVPSDRSLAAVRPRSMRVRPQCGAARVAHRVNTTVIPPPLTIAALIPDSL
jgi:hypothetical protein